MNYSTKTQLRELYHKSKTFSVIYRMASDIKTRHYMNMPDEEFIKRKFKENTGKELNLEYPQTFNEKIQWLKLYNHDPLYTTLVDKYAVKQYVANKIGNEHVIPVVGGPWRSANEIVFSKLPDQFVLKCNHDCGSIVICTDKTKLKTQAVKAKLNSALKKNYYYVGREWPYKNVRPCIFAEKYMVDESGYELKDYKFFCFNGEPKCMFIASDRMDNTEETKFDFFDMDFVHLPFTNGHPNATVCPNKPVFFDEMKQAAKMLSKGIPHVRVDFYEDTSNFYFGEMTFYHWGGCMPFQPLEWDRKLGDWIQLPIKR